MSQGNLRCLSDFIGDWRLRRQIHHADGTQATFSGTARWIRSDPGALYEETGTLHMAGQMPITGTRSYRWSETLDVSFKDGRFFHTVPAGGGSAAHWCDPDAYEVSYDFTDWPAFTTRWIVRGPRKDYQMVTDYTRADAP